MAEIFVSYSRRDREFVQMLVEMLRANGREVWIDFAEIPFGSDWWQEIVDGIDAAAVAIFCISPDSIRSEVCSLEIAELTQKHKKIIPIVIREPGESMNRLPHSVSHLNWIFFTDEYDFDTSFAHLVETIDTDLVTQKDLARLLVRAGEWEKDGRDSSMLLRGEELQSFLELQHLDLSFLQRHYLHVSEHHEMNRQQLLRFVFGFLGGVLAFGFYVFTTFRSDSWLSPKRITLTLAGGEIFGLFVGIIAVFGQDMVLQIKEHVPREMRLPLQILICAVAGILSWFMFQGVIYEFWPGLTRPIIIGGIGLSAGFIVNIMLRPPAFVTFLLTFIGVYLPIWAFNNFGKFLTSGGDQGLDPLIYFDFSRSQDMYRIGIPMALLLAFGANLQLLRQQWNLWREQRPKLKRKVKE